MTTKQKNTQIAESAIKLLREAINADNKKKILASYDLIEDDSFSWDNLDVLFDEFDSLTDEANSILYYID